jgi:hypothetical protein
MPAKVVFSDIQAYLDAISNNPNALGNVDESPHGRFWNVAYAQFTSGTLSTDQPKLLCGSQPISIVGRTEGSLSVDPANCPFYQALIQATGTCQKGQMPKFGPSSAFITDRNYTVTVRRKDGTESQMTGAEIRENIEWWLTHDLPEH